MAGVPLRSEDDQTGFGRLTREPLLDRREREFGRGERDSPSSTHLSRRPPLVLVNQTPTAFGLRLAMPMSA